MENSDILEVPTAAKDLNRKSFLQNKGGKFIGKAYN